MVRLKVGGLGREAVGPGTDIWTNKRRAPDCAPAEGMVVDALLTLSRAIDRLNEKFGVIANWLVLLACLISAGNAGSRYLFSASSNAWLEVQWYMFAGMVLLGAVLSVPFVLTPERLVRTHLVLRALAGLASVSLGGRMLYEFLSM